MVHLGMITPFSSFVQDHPHSSGRELQTEDLNSIGVPGGRNLELLSIDDRVSNSMRPESYNRKSRKPTKDNLLEDFKIERQTSQTSANETKTSIGSKVKAVFCLAFVMAFVFGVCMDVYFLHNLPEDGLHFIMLGLAAAFSTDLVIQLLVLLVLSSV